MTSALRRHAQAGAAGEADGSGDIGCRFGHGDGGRVLIDCQVPGPAANIPAGVAGPQNPGAQVSGWWT
jgi:hypothetical protein